MTPTRRYAFLGVAVVCALFLVPGAFAQDDEAPASEYPYFTIGYLTWNSGTGGIAWTPEVTTEDVGGKQTTAQDAVGEEAASYLGWNLYTNSAVVGTRGQELIAFDAFVGLGYPRLEFLNVSRPIELELYFTTAPCRTVDVELVSNGRVVAGALHGVSASLGEAPEAPSGQCGLRFLMWPETDRFHAGQVLTLRLIHHHDGQYGIPQSSPVQYSLKAPSRSILRFPLFPPEEVLTRVPDPSAGAASTETAETQAFLVLAPLVFGRARRNAHVLAAVVLVLTAGPLAGCLSSKSSDGPASANPLTGSISSTVEPGLGNSSTGAIAGTIRNDLGEPLEGAFIGLAMTSHHARADKYGNFGMTGVPAGTYGVRVDHEGYKALEDKVTVSAGNTTRLEVQLQPLVDRPSDQRSHPHDYWGGKETKTAFSGPVSYAASGFPDSSAASVYSCHWNYPFTDAATLQQLCRMPFFLPPGETEPNTIIPGTRDVEVTITWDPQENRVERAGFGFRPVGSDQEIVMYPKANGVSTHAGAIFGTTDVGHQAFTLWNLFIYVPTNTGDRAPSAYQISVYPKMSYQVITGPFTVTMTLHKGIIPLEPRHLDLWNGNQTLPILTEATREFSCPLACSFSDAGWRPPPGRVVPPETTWLEANFSFDRPTPGWEFRVQAKPANVSWAYNSDGETYTVAPFRDLPPPTVDGGTKTYRWRIQPAEADAFYADRSFWQFRIEDDDTSFRATYDPVESARTVTINVVAHRDAPPATVAAW